MSTAKAVMGIAQKYLGTKENPPNSNNVLFNTDYYGYAVSGDYPWCCVFVWDVFRIAGASNLFYDGKKTAYCPTYESWAIAQGLSVNKDNGQYGDIATMDFGKGRASHIGFILAKLSDGTYQTIEGNTSVTSDDNGGSVMVRIRPQSVIRYIFRPKYSTSMKNYLSRGDSGDAVKRMQAMLIAIGYSCGASGADGEFGADTEKAVKTFQTNQGLTLVDGLYGEQTAKNLEEVFNSMTTAKKAPDFTPEEFVNAVAAVYKMAHNGGYIYSDSTVLPPCADKKISCDRLEARALWNLGMTDQRKGGEVVSTFPAWLEAHGFKKITNKAQLQGGDFVFVDDERHNNVPDWKWHVFTLVSYEPKTGMCRKYDTGSNARIQANQPFNVQLEEWGGTKKFRFAYRSTYKKPVHGDLDGTYVIESAVDRNFVLDVKGASTKAKANIQLYKKNGTQAQSFRLEYVGDGYYKIINTKSGMAIDVSGAKIINRRNIWQYTVNDTKAQFWKPQKNADGSYTFISALNSAYTLDLYGGKARNEQNIHLYKSNNTNAQKWFLNKIK